MADKLNRWWLAATFALILIIIISSLIIWLRRDKGQPIAISISSPAASISQTPVSPNSSPALQTQKIDINRADARLLETLPGIGEVRAQAIIDYRNQYGAFTRTQDLLKVPGISASVFSKIKDYITVGETQ